MYKGKLNQLCQKNGWPNPKYYCIKDGHDTFTLSPLFKASVNVNGDTFSSQSIFESAKSAHNDAAALALSHLSITSRDLVNNSEVCLPVLQEDKAMATPPPPSDVTLSIEEPNRKKSMATPPPPSDATVSVKEPNRKKSMAIPPPPSYLLCKRVRVHTSIPTTELPKGTVMLPIGEDKWTVVSLESA